MELMKLRDIRKQKGIRQEDVASILGISIGAYSQLENGHIRMTVERAKDLAKILNIDVAYFFDNKFY